MHTARKWERRSSRPVSRTWYAVKDALAILGGVVLVHFVYRVIEASLYGSNPF